MRCSVVARSSVSAARCAISGVDRSSSRRAGTCRRMAHYRVRFREPSARFFMKRSVVSACVVVLAVVGAVGLAAQQGRPAPPPAFPQPFVRDPKILVDAEYTAKIKEYTTQPFFTSPLV